MELRQLRYFAAVARREHFTRAAEDLAVAQPALSQQIAQLERELRVRLFDRTSRRVRLTDAGRTLLETVERILADVESVSSEMHQYAGEVRGHVTLGTLQMLGELRLPKLLRRFHARYPLIEVALREGSTDELSAGLRSRSLELALVHFAETAPRGLVSEQLFVDELALAVPPGHRLATRRSVRFEELRDETFVAFKPGTAISRTVAAAAAQHGFTPKVTFESGDALTVRALVAEGLGVTVLPREVAEIPGPEVRIVPFSRPKLTRTIALAHLAQRRPSPASRLLGAFLREQLRG
ncbi:MAG: LysR family transcriptional regulator [Vulcanimicrobiaceae bacterium]|jgi:LysR family transcriptional activator of glutamate synthase operon